jgi:HEAT repeat
MAAKVDPGAVASHVPVLLTALLSCFADESWPVRDAACVATGRFAAAFPQQCRPQLDTLYGRWFKHLAEPIWSVREDSAAALGQVCYVI